jgi:glycosyltransferase involved in cell wall biosynthesis
VVLPDEGPLAEDLRADGVEVLIRPLAVLRREHMSPRGLAGIAARAARDAVQLRRIGAVLVHSNTSVVLSGAFVGLPHIWHVREIYTGFERVWPAYRRLLQSAAALPCVSHATAAQFTRKAIVIPDGLAVDATRMPRSEARSVLGLPAEPPAIAVLGRISSWKGQDVLVNALAAPELAGAIGLIAGDVWAGAEERLEVLLRISRQRQVYDRIRILGFRDDLSALYGAADVIAVPSTAPDPLPGSAIEAAAAGCAIVASAHGGLPEIIRDGVTGRLVAPGNPQVLARVARELIDDGPLRERLGAAAAADVRERFAPQRLTTAIGRLYDEVISRSA